MSISLTYDDTLSRVRIEAAGLAADEVRVERSTNELHWQIVRGGVALEPDSGALVLGDVDDYDFDADVENHYRIVDTSVDTVEEADSITPSLDGQIWLKSVPWPFLNRPVAVVEFTEPTLSARGSTSGVAGRSVPVSRSDKRTGDTFELELVTDTATEQRNMHLTLKSGNHFFIHLPAGCPVPGGHVRIQTIEPRRVTRSGRSPRRYWRFAATVVAPPGPDVVGGTMTYQALMNLYGSYSNTINSGLTYRQLMDLMADPEDLVVL